MQVDINHFKVKLTNVFKKSRKLEAGSVSKPQFISRRLILTAIRQTEALNGTSLRNHSCWVIAAVVGTSSLSLVADQQSLNDAFDGHAV